MFARAFKHDLIKKIFKNSGIILMGNTIASALNLISFIVMARQLGPEFLAILVLAQTYSLIINDIFNIQTWESLVKFGPASIKRDSVSNVIKPNLLLDVLSAIVAFCLALLLLKPAVYILGWDKSFINIISMYSLTILFNITTFTIGIPRLFDKFFPVAKVQVTVAIFRLLFVLGVMVWSNTLLSFVCVFLFCDVAANVSLIIYSSLLIKQKLGNNWWRTPMIIDKEQIRFIWWTNLRSIIRIPVRHFDMVVISTVMPMQTVGIYKVYKEIAGLINRVGEPVNQAIFPEFTKLLGGSEEKETASVAKMTIALLAVVGTIITAFMLLASKYIVGTFFGNEYLSHIGALYPMLILFGISFVTIPINSLFIAAGFAKYSFMILLLTNIVYLCVAFGFGSIYGIYGVIVAYAVQLLCNKGLKIMYLRKYAHDWVDLRK